MARAPSTGGVVSSDYIDLPDEFPARSATSPTRSPATRAPGFEKAVALQQWFREDGGFNYDLDASPGNGTDDLVRFLTEGEGGRTGYCEQFASAMAVMARILGIPARVAVGFLSPGRSGRRPGSTAPATCTPGRSSSSRDRAGSGSSPRRRDGPPTCPRYTTEQVDLPDEPGGPGLPRPSERLPGRGESSSASGEDAPRRTTSGTAGGVPVGTGPGRRRRSSCSRSGCCSCLPWYGAPARAAGSAPARRQPGPSCATPRSTWGWPGRSTGRPARRGTALVRQLRPAGAGRHRPNARCTAPTSRRSRSRRWTGSCSRRAAALRPGRPAGRREPAGRGPRDLRRVTCAGRRRRRRAVPAAGPRLADRRRCCGVGGARSASSGGAPTVEPLTVGWYRRRRSTTPVALSAGSEAAALPATAPALLHPLHEGAGGLLLGTPRLAAAAAAVDEGEAVRVLAGTGAGGSVAASLAADRGQRRWWPRRA